MVIAYVVIALFLSVALVLSAVGKVRRMEQVVENLSKAGVTDGMYRPLAAAEAAGAVGLVLGIWVPWLGVLAAAGVVLYFLGAVGFHVRAKDPGFGPAAFLGALGAAALVLRLLSA
ncbi:DoxX family protein [Phycicoccus sp. CSK15P-2]|uniref:DoxX family protein n=1 Tax=Phycicoccus sp. CSK15P-2 TaxID=2807627 RepID=UPI0019508F7F|nr:DoxX family protein [Phycicoccus sp. CSK15P-2]MBM6405388.1 DoxX family protein [Phycicoccus sp. CSK15P-2]